MMLFGGRNSPPWLRFLRIGLLVAILVLGATFHGKTYSTIHTVYLIVLVGLLVLSVSLGRRSGQGQGQGPQGRQGLQGRRNFGGGGFGSGPPPNPPTTAPSAAPARSPGTVPLPSSPPRPSAVDETHVTDVGDPGPDLNN